MDVKQYKHWRPLLNFCQYGWLDHNLHDSVSQKPDEPTYTVHYSDLLTLKSKRDWIKCIWSGHECPNLCPFLDHLLPLVCSLIKIIKNRFSLNESQIVNIVPWSSKCLPALHIKQIHNLFRQESYFLLFLNSLGYTCFLYLAVCSMKVSPQENIKRSQFRGPVGSFMHHRCHGWTSC